MPMLMLMLMPVPWLLRHGRHASSMPAGVQVDSTEAITHLEAAAERALAKLQSGWLAGFLASSAGVRLMADVAAGTEADYSALPTVSGATWLEQFETDSFHIGVSCRRCPFFAYVCVC